MPHIALKKLLAHRKLTTRDIVALLFLAIVVGSFVSNFIQYNHSQEALKSARQSRNILRRDRVLFEHKICNAVNTSRQINNRDRQSIITSRNETKHDLGLIRDPILKALLRKSLDQAKHEIEIRPHLSIFDCTKLVTNPGSVKVPSPGG